MVETGKDNVVSQPTTSVREKRELKLPWSSQGAGSEGGTSSVTNSVVTTSGQRSGELANLGQRSNQKDSPTRFHTRSQGKRRT